MMFRLNRKMRILTFSMILLFGNLSVKAEDDKLEFVAEGITIYDYSCLNFVISKSFYTIENLPKENFQFIDDIDYEKMIKVRDKIEDIIENEKDVYTYLNLPEKPKPLPEPHPEHYFYIITITPNNIKNIKFKYNGVCMRSVIHLEKQLSLDELKDKGIDDFFTKDERSEFFRSMDQFQDVIKKAVLSLYQSEIWKDIDETLIVKYQFKEFPNLRWDKHLGRYFHLESLIGKNKEKECKNLKCSDYLKTEYGDKFVQYTDWALINFGELNRIVIFDDLREDILFEVSNYEWLGFDSYVLFKQIQRITDEQRSIIMEESEILKRSFVSKLSFDFHCKKLNRLDQRNYFLINSLPIAESFSDGSKGVIGDWALSEYESLSNKNLEVKANVELLMTGYEHLQTIEILVFTMLIGFFSLFYSICSSRKNSKETKRLDNNIEELRGKVEIIDKNSNSLFEILAKNINNIMSNLKSTQTKLKSIYLREPKHSKKKKEAE